MASVCKRKSERNDKTAKWLVSWFDHDSEKWHNQTGYTDKAASLAMGMRLEKESADRREGITNTVRAESLKPVEVHLQEFLTNRRTKNRNAGYIEQLEQRIRRILDETGAKRLVDLTAGAVEVALLDMTCKRGFEKAPKLLAHSTRNEYVVSITGFTAWAKDRRKIDHDPLAGVGRVPENSVDAVHPRRALTVPEVVALLDAAMRRPEHELLVVRRGKDKGKLLADVRPSMLNRAKRIGRDRRMAYLLAIWTGLRRLELNQLRWSDLHLDVEVPYAQLRIAATKSRRGDVIPLHPQLVAELLAYRPEKLEAGSLVLPGRMPAMEVLKKDLAFAKIEYGNAEMGFADLHAQRKTLNTMLAANGVDSRVRQAQLRHTDPRLTENVYFDRSLYVKPQADQIARVPAIPFDSAVAIPAAGSQTKAINPAELAQENGRAEGQSRSSAGNEKLVGPIGMLESLDDEKPKIPREKGINEQGPAPCGTGPFLKRAKGVEPSTFTLAT